MSEIESIQEVEFSDVESQSLGRDLMAGIDLSLIGGVKVQLTAVLGRAELTVEELFSLKENSVVSLLSSRETPVELVLDGKVVANGKLVIVGDELGVQVSAIAKS